MCISPSIGSVAPHDIPAERWQRVCMVIEVKSDGKLIGRRHHSPKHDDDMDLDVDMACLSIWEQ